MKFRTNPRLVQGIWALTFHCTLSRIRITTPVKVNPPSRSLTEQTICIWTLLRLQGESNTHIQFFWLQMSSAPTLDHHPGSLREGEVVGRRTAAFPIHVISSVCMEPLRLAGITCSPTSYSNVLFLPACTRLAITIPNPAQIWVYV